MSAATRRRALGAIAATGATAAVVPALAAEQDPHLEWWRRHQQVDAERRTLPDDDGLLQPFLDEMWKLEALIIDTPATTLAGLRLQAVAGLLHVEAEMVADEAAELEVRALRAIRDACDRLTEVGA
jgi:hypothetical protein